MTTFVPTKRAVKIQKPSIRIAKKKYMAPLPSTMPRQKIYFFEANKFLCQAAQEFNEIGLDAYLERHAIALAK